MIWQIRVKRTSHFTLLSSLQDLLKVIYMDNNTSTLLDTDCTLSGNSEKVDPQTSENRTGIRTMCVSPDEVHLASGDRNGTLRFGTGLLNASARIDLK